MTSVSLNALKLMHGDMVYLNYYLQNRLGQSRLLTLRVKIPCTVPYVPARSLRSADQNMLTVKRYNLERYGRRSFSVAGPSLWNALPSAIRNSVSLPAFRSSLKTHLFREAFVTLM